MANYAFILPGATKTIEAPQIEDAIRRLLDDYSSFLDFSDGLNINILDALKNERVQGIRVDGELILEL